MEVDTNPQREPYYELHLYLRGPWKIHEILSGLYPVKVNKRILKTLHQQLRHHPASNYQQPRKY
jgi:hypothetical protein